MYPGAAAMEMRGGSGRVPISRRPPVAEASARLNQMPRRGAAALRGGSKVGAPRCHSLVSIKET